MSLAVRARQPLLKPHHGQFIYMYSNLRTNQVIYSLEKVVPTEKQERILLKQLTFYGKKTVPTSLRKDLWKPFATVTFPRPEDGLMVFRLLKEYRQVRDHAWTFAPTESDIILAQQQAETQQKEEVYPSDVNEATDFVGPWKYQTRYDNVMGHYTQWPDKKERAKLLMDQRATTVADLAHTIERQMNQHNSTAKQRFADKQRAKLWAKIQSLAATPVAEIKQLEDERTTLEAVTSAIPAHTQQGHAEKARLKKRARRIAEITAQLGRVRKASEAVAFAAGEDVPESQRRKWAPAMKYIVQTQVPDTPVLSTYDAAAAIARNQARREAPLTEESIRKATARAARKKAELSNRDRLSLKAAGPDADRRAEKGIAENGILIQWAHLPDAQFAASWHENVAHEEMEDKKVQSVRRAIARLEGAYANVDSPVGDGSTQKKGPVMSEPEKTGWLGGLNPMRLFKSGEARS